MKIAPDKVEGDEAVSGDGSPPGGATVIGSLSELRSTGRLLGKVGSLPVLVVWHDGEASAIEDRCPHLGFPLHRGTIESGMITCHWHHARFDMASGCTLDPWADDAAGFSVSIDDDEVRVSPRRSDVSIERAVERLRKGVELNLTLVIAKAVHALVELPDGERRILQVAYEIGEANRADGWGSGLTVLTCMANLLPHLRGEDRALALVHAVRFVARDIAGQPRRVRLGALDAAGQPPQRLAGWYRRFVETRSSDGAERALATLVAADGSEPGLAEDAMFATVTDHIFIDGGHVLDFTNKAFEAITAHGGDPATLLTSLVSQTCRADRSEESSEWNHPHDLVTLADTTQQVIEASNTPVNDAGFEPVAGRLGAELLIDDPDAAMAALVAARRGGASFEQLARAVALAAALRLARFHTNNEQGDWQTVHHTFTFANAVHQSVVRRPQAPVVRGIVHGALRVYLDRFLNVPAARTPVPRRGSLDGLEACWDVQGNLEAAAAIVAGSARTDRPGVIAALGTALLREDADFHMYQSLEAGVRQALAWPPDSDESVAILVGITRFLAAHTPTRRELSSINATAVRLRRGEELFADG
jgi:nitrite reductase/ring-hydroxylating ferredoxin subunit